MLLEALAPQLCCVEASKDFQVKTSEQSDIVDKGCNTVFHIEARLCPAYYQVKSLVRGPLDIVADRFRALQCPFGLDISWGHNEYIPS